MLNCNADESATRVLAGHESRCAVEFPSGLKLVLVLSLEATCSHLRHDLSEGQPRVGSLGASALECWRKLWPSSSEVASAEPNLTR